MPFLVQVDGRAREHGCVHPIPFERRQRGCESTNGHNRDISPRQPMPLHDAGNKNWFGEPMVETPMTAPFRSSTLRSLLLFPGDTTSARKSPRSSVTKDVIICPSDAVESV